MSNIYVIVRFYLSVSNPALPNMCADPVNGIAAILFVHADERRGWSSGGQIRSVCFRGRNIST